MKRAGADLNELHRDSYVSQRGLEAILKRVRADGLPSASSSRSQLRARHAFTSEPTPYGPVVQPMELTLEDRTVGIAFVNHPFALLDRTVRECAPFRQIMKAKLAKFPSSPSTPWRLIIYFDEVSPTNPLASKKDPRKVQSFYWTFAEFENLVHREEMWFIVTCTPSLIVETMDSGMSQLVKHVLKHMFFNDESHHLTKTGICLDLRESENDTNDFTRLFARHYGTLADFKAIKEVLGSMGHRGIVPCPLCRNIAKDGRFGHLPLDNLECHLWEPHSDASVRNLLGELMVAKTVLGKTAYAELETRKGFHYGPHYLTADAAMKPISTTMYDWPHIYFITGLFEYDLDEFMHKAKAAAGRNKKGLVEYTDLHAYMQQWTWPREYKRTAEIFETNKLAATASEQLSATPVVQRYFSNVVAKEESLAALHGAAESVSLCCESIEMLQCASRKQVSAVQLHDCIMKHLHKFRDVHGRGPWQFKHHQAAHLGPQYRDFGCLFDTFVTERRHKDPKKFAMNRQSRGIYYTRGLMEELCCQHFADLKQFSTHVSGNWSALPKALRMPVGEMFPRAANIEISGTFVAESGAKFSNLDVVLLGGDRRRQCGQIWYHFCVDGTYWTCISMWEFRRADGRYAKYKRAEKPTLVLSNELLAHGIWRSSADGAVTVIWPLHYMFACGLM